MRYNASQPMFLMLAIFCLAFYSCIKQTGNQSNPNNTGNLYPDVFHNNRYNIEEIDQYNFKKKGWKKQQVNIVSGDTLFSDSSRHADFVCGPPREDIFLILSPGCVTMSLPTSTDATLLSVDFRKHGYAGTRLADLSSLAYSTYVENKAPASIVLHIDIDNDDEKDFRIFFSPTERWQNNPNNPVVPNTWQSWDALQGIWHIEDGELPEFPDDNITISQLINIPEYTYARIIDSPDGGGVQFTIGGKPRREYDDSIGYLDAIIIGTKDNEKPTLYHFVCSQ